MKVTTKAGEEWARRILQNELRCAVNINDDGSKPGMYDLRIGAVEAPDVAIECVGAVDSHYTESWNVGPAKNPLDLPIAGDWMVTISVSARVNVVRQQVERLLKELESRGIYEVRADHWLKRCELHLFAQFESLGIEQASCYRLQGTGKVHLEMPGIGGAVDETGSAVPRWISEFLRNPARVDVLGKLQRSGARQRYAFVLVSFRGAPWPVESYLTGALDELPIQGPNLPPSVTGIWLVSTFGRKGVRWDGESWHQFNARGEGIDEEAPN